MPQWLKHRHSLGLGFSRKGADPELGRGPGAAARSLSSSLINRAFHRAVVCILFFSICIVVFQFQEYVSMESLKAYSPSEIYLHASKKDCWLSINGKVYDVTSFVVEHPGGEDAILEAAAGGDASRAFEEVGHSSTATAMMKDLLIGTVEGYSSGPPKPFFGPMLSQSQQQAKPGSSSAGSAFLLPLLALAVAVAAWYYFSFLAKVNA